MATINSLAHQAQAYLGQTPTVAARTTTATTSSSSSDSSSSSSSLTGIAPSEGTFLTLLVSQLKNQDPLNPTDSTQFVSELAQFSSLEQLININQGVTTLASATTGSSTSSSSGTSGTTSTSSSGTSSSSNSSTGSSSTSSIDSTLDNSLLNSIG